MPAGRPIKITVEELNSRVNTYLEGDKVTLAGLAYHIGIDRQTLYNYAERDEFFDIIKSAREAIEARYESRLIYESTPTGVIFALKNMGWSDKQEIDHTSKGEKIKTNPDIHVYNTAPPMASSEDQVDTE